MNNQKELQKFWLMIAKYYQKDISLDVIRIYADHSSRFSIEDMKRGFEMHCESDSAAFFPVPALLIKHIRPRIDEKDEAMEVPGIIFSAITKFGYINGPEARLHMGPLAWSCVQDYGGWNHLCSSPMTNETAVRAQLRELAKSKINRAQAGRSQLKPGEGIAALLPDVDNSNESAAQIDSRVSGLLSTALTQKTAP